MLVGNSSAGLVETPYFPIPSINIGERQKGRLCSSNVIHCESSRSKIEDALRQIEDNFDFHEQVERCERPFGEGGAGAKIASTLDVVDLDGSIFGKRITCPPLLRYSSTLLSEIVFKIAGFNINTTSCSYN